MVEARCRVVLEAAGAVPEADGRQEAPLEVLRLDFFGRFPTSRRKVDLVVNLLDRVQVLLRGLGFYVSGCRQR